MKRTRIWIAGVLLAGLTTACSAPDNSQTPDPQPIVKRERLSLTKPPDCKLDFQVFKPQGTELSTFARVLLEKQGTGIAGLSEGSPVSVTCEADKGSGWIDRDGELQSFIAPDKGWFVERRGGVWTAVSGQIEILTKQVLVDDSTVEASYTRLTGGSPSRYSRRLLARIGIGLELEKSPVLVMSKDGQRRKGLLAPSGAFSITSEAWED